MTYNVHSLLHFVQSVKMAGPLWTSSAFYFESNMSVLRRQCLSTKGVLQQISKRTLQILSLRFPEKIMSEKAAKFCKDLMSPYRVKHCYTDEETDAIFIGGKGSIEIDANVRTFDRCVYNFTVYCSTLYKRF